MSYKISYILPIYKVEKQLPRCIESVINQDYDNIEIILVDDGSPDGCPKICDDFAKKDRRIKVVHKQNQGLGMARNSGMEVASGDFVIFVDSDDFIEPSMGSKLLKALLHSESQVAYCNYCRVDTFHGVKTDVIQTIEKHCFENEEVLKVLLGMFSNYNNNRLDGSINMSVWHSMYDLHFIKDHHILFKTEREYISEDLMFHIDFLTEANRVVFIDDVLYNYDFNPDSLSAKFRPFIFDSSKKIYLYANKKFLSKSFKNFHSFTDRYLLVITLYIIKNYKQFFTSKDYKNFIKKILCDEVWSNDIEYSSYANLSFKNKLFVKSIRYNSFFMLKVLSYICETKNKIKGK